MSETAEKIRRWNAYVCPDCRAVMRVARDRDDAACVCPNCKRLLRIPSPGETTPPLVIPLTSAEERAKRRRRRKRGSQRTHASEDWEQENDSMDAAGGDSAKQSRSTLWIGAIALLATVTAVVLALKIRPADEPRPTSASAANPTEPTSDEPKRLTEIVFLDQARQVAEKFLSATHVDELADLVRNPEVALPRIRDYYADGKIDAVGMADFNTRSNLKEQGSFRFVGVKTGEFLEKSMAFVETPDGLRIDWEAWVGWSEMPWDRFIEEKPTEPKLFRVLARRVAYYNFDFSDDQKWRSHRLDSPDKEFSLFGYTEIGSESDTSIIVAPEMKEVPYALYLSFPENAKSSNQVRIVKVASKPWVIENEEAP